MITTKEQQFIKKYVDNRFYDQEKLIKYLAMHEVVGTEIFSYCDRMVEGKKTFSRWLEDDDGYAPLPVSEFIKRVPFYFYTRDKNALPRVYGDLESLHSCYAQIQDNVNNFEPLYEALDFMFYDLRLPLNKIFSYWIDQTHLVSGEGNNMKPLELFYLLSTASNRDDFIKILRKNRVKPQIFKPKKKST